MTYNTSSADALDDHLLKDTGISRGENAPVTPRTTGLHHEDRKLPAHGQLRAAAGSDGIKAFMMNFTATTAKAEIGISNKDVTPATRDFLKASSFLFRK